MFISYRYTENFCQLNSYFFVYPLGGKIYEVVFEFERLLVDEWYLVYYTRNPERAFLCLFSLP